MSRITHIHPEKVQDSYWRIQIIPDRSEGTCRTYRLSIALTVSTAIFLIGVIAFMRSSFDTTTFIAICLFSCIPIIRRLIFRRKQEHPHWLPIEAHAIDKEVCSFKDNTGKRWWQVRILAEFLHNGLLWKATPKLDDWYFPTKESAEAFLTEHIGDVNEITLNVNAHNPLETKF